MPDKADRRAPTERQRFISDFPGRARHYGDKDTDYGRGACGSYGATTPDPERVICKRCFKTLRWRRS